METLSMKQRKKIYNELMEYMKALKQRGENLDTPKFQQFCSAMNGVQRDEITPEKGEELKRIQEMLYKREITGIITTYNRMISQGNRRIRGRIYSGNCKAIIVI